MPLRHGKTSKTIKANIAKNIRTEVKHGRTVKEAVRIAYGTAEERLNILFIIRTDRT
jgi:hypothetical protein